MYKKKNLWLQWIKTVFQPPHPLWNQKMPNGEAVIEIRQPMLAGLLIGILILYIFFPQKMIVICLVTLLGIFASAFTWVRLLANRLQAHRKLQFAAVQVGDELEENIWFQNNSFLPVLWISVEDYSNFPAYSIRSVRAVDPHSRTVWRNHLTCKQRGIFNLGPWQWVTSDPFGIFFLRRVYTHTQEMIVYPPLASLPAAFFPTGKQVGDLRPLNQPLAAETILATHTRPYQPGDPLRRIHWRTTARRGNPFIKIFDPEAASRIWLVPDLDASVHTNNSPEQANWQSSSEETMILLLSALASQYLNEHRSVGLFAGLETRQIVLPQRGPSQFWQILGALTPLHADRTQTFAATLQQLPGLLSARDLVIAVTCSLSSDWVVALAQIMHSFGGSAARSFLIDPNRYGFTGNVQGLMETAIGLGIETRIVAPEDLSIQSGGLGSLRRWEFKTLGTGKVVVRNAPRLVEDWAEMGTKRWQ